MSTAATHPSGGAPYARYTAIAILFHWTIAVLMLFQLGFGFWMGRALKSDDEAVRFAAFEAVQTHKSVGLLVLALSLGRLAWRLARPGPTAPSTMPGWQQWASTASHWAFYGVMIALPMTGWAMVSTSPEFKSAPTLLFGGPHVPHLPLVGGADAFANAHGALVWITVALIALHVAAALKHHFVDQDAVFARMVPGVSPRSGSDGVVAGEPCAPERPSGLRRMAGAGLAGALAIGIAALLAPGGERAAGGDAAATVLVEDAGDGGAATRWTVVAEDSAIGFSGEHSGQAFSGRFERWSAEIAFDPAALDQTRIRVAVETASAVTGNPLYDGALPEADWFDAAAHPLAVFEASEVVAGDGEGAFVANGILSIKGVAQPASLPFELAIAGDRATVAAAITLDRLAFELGRAADATGAWVSLEIPLEISVTATRAP